VKSLLYNELFLHFGWEIPPNRRYIKSAMGVLSFRKVLVLDFLHA